MSDVRNDEASSRYELEAEDAMAIAVYRREGDVLVFTHTEVPAALEGRGIATRLIAGALADVRAQGAKIRPQCPFVADYVRKHPELRDLVAD